MDYIYLVVEVGINNDMDQSEFRNVIGAVLDDPVEAICVVQQHMKKLYEDPSNKQYSNENYQVERYDVDTVPIIHYCPEDPHDDPSVNDNLEE